MPNGTSINILRFFTTAAYILSALRARHASPSNRAYGIVTRVLSVLDLRANARLCGYQSKKSIVTLDNCTSAYCHCHSDGLCLKRHISVFVDFVAVVNVFVVFVGNVVIARRRRLSCLVRAERHIERHIGIRSCNLVQIL